MAPTELRSQRIRLCRFVIPTQFRQSECADTVVLEHGWIAPDEFIEKYQRLLCPTRDDQDHAVHPLDPELIDGLNGLVNRKSLGESAHEAVEVASEHMLLD